MQPEVQLEPSCAVICKDCQPYLFIAVGEWSVRELFGRMAAVRGQWVGGSLLMGGDMRQTEGRWRSLCVTRSLLWLGAA
jgi:hypothetical protein